jgi:outer membrane lipoprotein SlyB
MSSSTPSTSFGEGPIRVGGGSFSRPAAMIGGATALIAVTAIATTLVVRSPSHSGSDSAIEARSAPVATQSPVQSNASPARATGQVIDERADAPTPKAAPVNTTRAATPKTAPAAKPAAERVAAACAQCGVVEAVAPFQQKGEGTGVGAVGGAVVGGLLGSQIGGGGGKKAMTVIGAVGGGLAGNEIEKRQRATTLYSVKVRMEDGSLRTLTQSTAPTVGQKVTVEGSTLKARG